MIHTNMGGGRGREQTYTAQPYISLVRRIVRSTRYERAAVRLLPPFVQQELEESIASEPEWHPVIPGTGGSGKRDGGDPEVARVVVFE